MSEAQTFPTLDDIKAAWKVFVSAPSFESFCGVSDKVRILMMEGKITMDHVFQLRDVPGQAGGRNLMQFVLDLAGNAIVPPDIAGEGSGRVVSEIFVVPFIGPGRKLLRAFGDDEFGKDIASAIKEFATDSEATMVLLPMQALDTMKVASLCPSYVNELAWTATDIPDEEASLEAGQNFTDLLEVLALSEGDLKKLDTGERTTVCLVGAIAVSGSAERIGLPGGDDQGAWERRLLPLKLDYGVSILRPKVWTDFLTTACVLYTSSRIHELVSMEPTLIVPDFREIHLYPSLTDTGLHLQAYLHDEKYLGSVEVPGSHLVTNLPLVLHHLSQTYPMHPVEADPLPVSAVV